MFYLFIDFFDYWWINDAKKINLLNVVCLPFDCYLLLKILLTIGI